MELSCQRTFLITCTAFKTDIDGAVGFFGFHKDDGRRFVCVCVFFDRPWKLVCRMGVCARCCRNVVTSEGLVFLSERTRRRREAQKDKPVVLTSLLVSH